MYYKSLTRIVMRLLAQIEHKIDQITTVDELALACERLNDASAEAQKIDQSIVGFRSWAVKVRITHPELAYVFENMVHAPTFERRAVPLPRPGRADLNINSTLCDSSSCEITIDERVDDTCDRNVSINGFNASARAAIASTFKEGLTPPPMHYIYDADSATVRDPNNEADLTRFFFQN